MLIFDLYTIGNKLYTIRKKMGITQAEVAEKAGISDRSYADIERGVTNMRTETLLKICEAMSITPDEILTENTSLEYKQDNLIDQLSLCTLREKETALNLLEVYLHSLT